MKRASSRASIWSRAVVSLIRIGMLTPATTSDPPSRATARLWLVGVSPSISVRMRTPCPRSTRRTAAATRSRISSGLSSYEVAIASSPSIGPRTLSSVCTISTATRPCPITMMPTMTKIYSPTPGAARRRSHRLSTLGVAVPEQHGVAAGREPAAELLDQHDGAVAAPRAAEGDGEIALPLAQVARQGEIEEVGEPLQELLGLVAREDVLGHRRVGPGAVTELLDEEGIRQEAAVDREVGVARETVLVAEGHERHGHRAGPGAPDQLAERGAEFVNGERARVEDAVGDLPQGPQLLALATDAVGQAAALGRGMRKPRSSSPRMAVLLPEPESPVTTTTRKRPLTTAGGLPPRRDRSAA